ncbi:MAG TPA: HEAT repeat domain-containing protein [Phycisphaerae bacterium]|nr:HEAT repeat domain-containing protein [Phycisphaerae bacterium]
MNARHVRRGLVVAAIVLSSMAAEAPELDMNAAREEVAKSYSKAEPEVQEFVLETARTFGRGGLWVNEDAYAELTPEEREARVVYLAKLFEDGEYGRHLCAGLAEASALKDARLVPGLMKVAGYSVEGKDYDCRPKWMAVAALARQESDAAVPLLVSLVDHGNQNTRMWARAALARMAEADFKADKQAWNKWWVGKGHPAIEEKYLKASVPPGGGEGG